MRDRLIFSAAAAMALFALWRAAYAHHGIASWFDMSRPASVKGTVTGFDWINPHCYIYFDVKDEKGAIQKWKAEMSSVATLVKAGWRKNTVKAGDEITLVGKLAKDGRPRMILDKVVFGNGQELATNDVPTPTIPNGQ
jgi:exonuclease VII large subunit